MLPDAKGLVGPNLIVREILVLTVFVAEIMRSSLIVMLFAVLVVTAIVLLDCS